MLHTCPVELMHTVKRIPKVRQRTVGRTLKGSEAIGHQKIGNITEQHMVCTCSGAVFTSNWPVAC